MMIQQETKKKLTNVLGGESILFIIPPFVNTRTPILGPHILQAISRDMGFKADVLYVNLLLASIIGNDQYEYISYGQPFRMLGERLFSRSAHGLPQMGVNPEACLDPMLSVFGEQYRYPLEAFEYKYYETHGFDLDTFRSIEQICYALAALIAETVSGMNYRIMGCSTNWEQNNASIALINQVKALNPDITTLIGGSNCEAEMAGGISSLSPQIDYIFSGESENTFTAFLDDYAKGKLPDNRIIVGTPIENLEDFSLPDFSAYFTQTEQFFKDDGPRENVIGYEASRGCWWGKCTFCGQNGKRVKYRQKSAAKVAKELSQISKTYPGKRILLIDKVVPITFYNDLPPLLEALGGTAPLSCEHRTDLSLSELIGLSKSNIDIIKFGIEGLSTGLLKLMKKGVSASQNITLLRYADSCRIKIDWNLLWGFPGDKLAYYRETLELIPLITHLCPPAVFRHLSLDRFCTYFKLPRRFDIRGLRPWAVNQMVYPEWADIENLAYRFTGDYPCDAHQHPDIIRDISYQLEDWRRCWNKSVLALNAFGNHFIVQDTRPMHVKNIAHILDRDKAGEIMSIAGYTGTPNQLWAVEHKLAVVLDGQYVPLITAQPSILLMLESGAWPASSEKNVRK